MAPGKLDDPARKLLISDTPSICFESGSWYFNDNEKKFEIKLICLQGTISEINSSNDEICLKEGEIRVRVRNCKNIPGGNGWMKLGQYIMVFGEIESQEPSTLVVRAIKLSDLSHNPVFQKMWPDEVKEAQYIYTHETMEP